MGWLTRLFINEAKPALSRHSGSGSDDDTQAYILVDENGNEFPAVMVDEETVFDADANDIRVGKVAATDKGIVVGEKEIPIYHTIEGAALVLPGKVFSFVTQLYDFTKLQGIICKFGSSISNSVSAERVAINGNVYDVLSTSVVSSLSKDENSKTINFGIVNDSSSVYVIRYFMYKEEI